MKQRIRMAIIESAWWIAVTIGIAFLVAFLFRITPMPTPIVKTFVAIEIVAIIIILVLDHE